MGPLFFLFTGRLLANWLITKRKASTDVLFVAKSFSFLMQSLTQVQGGLHFGRHPRTEVSERFWIDHME